MATDKFQRSSINQHAPQKSPEDDAAGLVERAVREGTPLDQLRLRESGEGRTNLLALARQKIADLAGITLIELPQEGEAQADVQGFVRTDSTAEAQAENPLLGKLKTQYEALPEQDRTCGKGLMTWEQVVAAIPDANEFLEGVNSLSDPEVYWIDEGGQLVVGDGCTEPAQETLNLNYNESRIAAAAVVNRGLITLNEYKRKNKGQFEVTKWIWVESGEKPSVARDAGWFLGYVSSAGCNANIQGVILGSRRVLRVKLNLES